MSNLQIELYLKEAESHSKSIIKPRWYKLFNVSGKWLYRQVNIYGRWCRQYMVDIFRILLRILQYSSLSYRLIIFNDTLHDNDHSFRIRLSMKSDEVSFPTHLLQWLLFSLFIVVSSIFFNKTIYLLYIFVIIIIIAMIHHILSKIAALQLSSILQLIRDSDVTTQHIITSIQHLQYLYLNNKLWNVDMPLYHHIDATSHHRYESIDTIKNAIHHYIVTINIMLKLKLSIPDSLPLHDQINQLLSYNHAMNKAIMYRMVDVVHDMSLTSMLTIPASLLEIYHHLRSYHVYIHYISRIYFSPIHDDIIDDHTYTSSSTMMMKRVSSYGSIRRSLHIIRKKHDANMMMLYHLELFLSSPSCISMIQSSSYDHHHIYKMMQSILFSLDHDHIIIADDDHDDDKMIEKLSSRLVSRDDIASIMHDMMILGDFHTLTTKSSSHDTSSSISSSQPSSSDTIHIINHDDASQLNNMIIYGNTDIISTSSSSFSVSSHHSRYVDIYTAMVHKDFISSSSSNMRAHDAYDDENMKHEKKRYDDLLWELKHQVHINAQDMIEQIQPSCIADEVIIAADDIIDDGDIMADDDMITSTANRRMSMMQLQQQISLMISTRNEHDDVYD